MSIADMLINKNKSLNTINTKRLSIVMAYQLLLLILNAGLPPIQQHELHRAYASTSLKTLGLNMS
jgi:hypothetical protein